MVKLMDPFQPKMTTVTGTVLYAFVYISGVRESKEYFRFFVGNNTKIIGSYSEIIG